VRIGLRYVKGLHKNDGARIVACRKEGPFRSLEDFAARTELERPVLSRLAESGALECFGLERRSALWEALGIVNGEWKLVKEEGTERAAVVEPAEGMGDRADRTDRADLQEKEDDFGRDDPPTAQDQSDARPQPATSAPYSSSSSSPFILQPSAFLFPPLNSLETIHWDYACTGHSTRGHPLAPLREELQRQGLPDAATLRTQPDGQRVRYAGLVICRQRPGTAGGVLFMTLEDESGFVNLVIWERVFQKYALLARTQSFLGVTGKLQAQAGVVHLVAEELWAPEIDQEALEAKSRDFR